ncbi:hypothetical protein [Brevibacillus sp. FSL K6-6036]|uniref:hypothetical protein n=1 Tax=Brevibacillus TaxID=55080 RepID=UPI0030CBB5BC
MNAESMLFILQKPITDSVAFFTEKHGIYLKPTASIQKLLVFSPLSTGGKRPTSNKKV